MNKYLYTLIATLFFIFSYSQSYEVPEKLHSDKAVQDYVNLLSQSEQESLNKILQHYADSTSTGIVVAIVDNVEDDINFEAAQILSKWGIGQKGKDNGVLILLASNQRKVAFSTGYGVEDRLTDAISRRIIQNDMIPHFKKKDYYGGLNAGIHAITQVLAGAYQASEKKDSSSSSWLDLLPFIIIMIFVFLVMFKGNKNGGDNSGNGRGGGMSPLDFIILGSMGRRSSGGFGGGFGGSSGGGFGGFGGGMGGGGGASGGW